MPEGPTGSPQADKKLDSVKLKLLGWLGLCHCSAQQRRSLLRANQLKRLSGNRQLSARGTGSAQPACCWRRLLRTDWVWTLSAPSTSNSSHKPRWKEVIRLQLRKWERIPDLVGTILDNNNTSFQPRVVFTTSFAHFIHWNQQSKTCKYEKRNFENFCKKHTISAEWSTFNSDSSSLILWTQFFPRSFRLSAWCELLTC